MPEYPHLRRFIEVTSPKVSAISKLEVLGFHKLDGQEEDYFKDFFRAASVLPISDAILEQAISLRKKRKMTVGDSIIAGTCIDADLELATRNVHDFQWIPNLQVVNPVDEGGPNSTL